MTNKETTLKALEKFISDYEKMVEEQPEALLSRYILRMQKLPQDEISEKALEYGVNALLGHNICR